MFKKLTTLCVAGALFALVGSQARAQDFWGNWGARPTYNSAPARHTGLLGLGILPVGPVVSSGCPNGNCGPSSCANGRCPTPAYPASCPNGQCGVQPYGSMPVYRSTQYQPAYQPTYARPVYPQPTYGTPNYNGYYQPGYQPAYRPTGYNSANSPFYE